MADYTITIKVVNDSLEYECGNNPQADSLKVYPGDTVNWTCADGDYGVNFKSQWPFDQPKDSVDLSAPSGTPTGAGTSKKYKDKMKHHHPYSVAVHVGGPNPVIIDDPDLIIDDGGGGGRRVGTKHRKTPQTARRPAPAKAK